MVTPIMGKHTTAGAFDTATTYSPLSNGHGRAVSSTITPAENVAPTAGTLTMLFVLLNVAPGGVTSRTATLMKNGAPTALTCTITGAALSGSDIANSVSFVAGDLLTIQWSVVGLPATGANPAWSVLSTGVDSWLGGSMSANYSAAVANYQPIMSGGGVFPTVLSGAEAPVSTPGTLTNLYVKLTAAPGAAASGKSVRVRLMKNGAPTALTLTLLETATSANITTNVTVAAGDVFAFEITPTATPTAARCLATMAFTPTTLGQSIQSGVTNTAIAQNLTRYDDLSGASAAVAAASRLNASFAAACVLRLRYLYVLSETAPAGVQTHITSIDKNAAATGITATVTGAATTANDITNTTTCAQGDLLVVKLVTSATAASSFLAWGITVEAIAVYAETITDAEGLTDSVAVAPDVVASDSIGLTDAAVAAAAVGLVDTLGITDPLAVDVAVTIVDQLDLTDLIVVSFVLGVLLDCARILLIPYDADIDVAAWTATVCVVPYTAEVEMLDDCPDC